MSSGCLGPLLYPLEVSQNLLIDPFIFHDINLFSFFCWIFNFRLWLLLFKTLNLKGTFNSFSIAKIAIRCLPLSVSFLIFYCFWVFECALCNSVKFCFLFLISSIFITFEICSIFYKFSTSVMIKCSIWIL